MIGEDEIDARVKRLEELCKGLAREVTIWRQADDLLLYLERRAYMNRIQDGLAGLEGARVVLVRALLRVREGKARRNGVDGSSEHDQGGAA